MSDRNPSILAISSTVAVGHVGLSAILPTLNLIGRTAAALPTTTLSNHPGFEHFAGAQVDTKILSDMINALGQNGWLADIDTILTGYLPSEAHVAFAQSTISLIRKHNPVARLVCDPVLGDDPKGLYIDEAAAIAIRDRLVPLADILIPNRFELARLTGRSVASPAEAITAARALGVTQTIVKSVPACMTQICNIDIRRDTATSITLQLQSDVPNGTGDMLSALIAAGWPLARATAALSSVIDASVGQLHLPIVPAADEWRSAAPFAAVEHT